MILSEQWLRVVPSVLVEEVDGLEEESLVRRFAAAVWRISVLRWLRHNHRF
jgi:hypothetical protein